MGSTYKKMDIRNFSADLSFVKEPLRSGVLHSVAAADILKHFGSFTISGNGFKVTVEELRASGEKYLLNCSVKMELNL